ncbi:MAG: hypothetical protein NT049_01690 [Planctomycetota bacterium]|nr:hypothetical protein [Planctomycetota bacterium]
MDRLVLYAIFGIVALPIAIFLGFIPGMIARNRCHAKASDVKVLGLIGIVVPFAWIAAPIWAYVGETEGEGERRRTVDRSVYDPLEDVHAPFDDSMIGLPTQDKTETCANCARVIGKLETPHVWKGAVICATCRKVLEQSEAGV